MKKAFITLFLSTTLLFGGCAFATEDDTSTQSTNLTELQEAIDVYASKKDNAHNMAEAARDLGYEEDHYVIELAKEEWSDANDQYIYYNSLYEQVEAEWQTKKNEYPEATTIWLYLKNLGYNNYVCAGIMGNIMAEVGGQTLNIDPYLKTGQYSGICQWTSSYSDARNSNLNDQLNLLSDTIQYEFDTYGKLYKKNFDYSDFLNLSDEKDAALAFAKCYERCGSGSYSVRQKNATKAYEYFVN